MMGHDKTKKDMKQFILSLLGLGSPLQRIQASSDGALGVFRKTLLKLRATQKKISDHHTVQDAIIKEATVVKTALDNIAATNLKAIAKLEDLLG